jgi:hypothetical protein
MAMVSWPDGVESAPDGSAVRQIPQRRVWTSSVWISQDGVAWRRFFNVVTKQWHWDAQPLSIVFEGEQDGFMLEWFTSTDRALAMAWLHRHPDSGAQVRRRVDVVLLDGGASPAPSEGPRLGALSWDVDEDPDGDAPRSERWRPLRWRVGAVECDRRYAISTAGRLRSPSGRVTAGLWYNGRRWAAVRNAGLVDLWTASGLDTTERIQPAIRMARDALVMSHTPAELAEAADLAEGTAWSYFARAAAFVPGKELRRFVPPLVGRRLWTALQRLEGREVLGGTLTDLMAALARRDKTFAGGEQMSQLRLARVALTAA